MATIRIFLDETGTMPVRDRDSPFAAAAIATIDTVPVIHRPTGTGERWIVENITLNAGIPRVSYLKPFAGYEHAIETKISNWDTMARATRLITGANEKYLVPSETGKAAVPKANTLWLYYMQKAAHDAFVSAVLTTPSVIDSLELILDRKTLNAATVNQFVRMATTMPDRLIGILASLSRYPVPARILRQLQSASISVSVKWEGDSGMEWAADGLRLADRLANSASKFLRKPRKYPLAQHLESAGFRSSIADDTQWVREG